MGVRKKRPPRRKNAGKKARIVVALKSGRLNKKKEGILGFMTGRMEIVEDIESPIEDWKYWNPAKNLED